MIPNTFQTPNIYIDRLAPLLQPAELRVLLYLTRRVFGFPERRKAGLPADVSLPDLVDGRLRDNVRHDHGAGVTKSGAQRAIRALKQYGIAAELSPQKGRSCKTWTLQLDEHLIDWPGLELRSQPGGDAVSDDRRVVTSDYPSDRRVVTSDYPGDDRRVVTSDYPKNRRVVTSDYSPIYIGKETQLLETKTTTTERDVVVALVARGITESVAEKLTADHDDDRIEQKIAYLDWILENDPRGVKAPAGWLRRAIEDNYAAPDGYGQAKAGTAASYLPAEYAEIIVG